MIRYERTLGDPGLAQNGTAALHGRFQEWMAQAREVFALQPCQRSCLDASLLLAFLGAIVFWIGWMLVGSTAAPHSGSLLWSAAWFSPILVQPCLEELLFRGALQGELRQLVWAQRGWNGFTPANGITALVFAAAHLWSHSAGWAAAIIVPSLTMGYLRDRYQSLFPSIGIHIFYNIGYALFCL